MDAIIFSVAMLIQMITIIIGYYYENRNTILCGGFLGIITGLLLIASVIKH